MISREAIQVADGADEVTEEVALLDWGWVVEGFGAVPVYWRRSRESRKRAPVLTEDRRWLNASIL